jgi:hypothetical protein
MKLCTFEVQTQVGRFQRLGAVIPGMIVDLNFAFERMLDRHGDPQPKTLAAARVPPRMLDFLDAGERALEDACRAISFLEESGETAGIDGQTLLYRPNEVKLLSPLPNPRSIRDFYAF